MKKNTCAVINSFVNTGWNIWSVIAIARWAIPSINTLFGMIANGAKIADLDKWIMLWLSDTIILVITIGISLFVVEYFNKFIKISFGD